MNNICDTSYNIWPLNGLCVKLYKDAEAELGGKDYYTRWDVEEEEKEASMHMAYL